MGALRYARVTTFRLRLKLRFNELCLAHGLELLLVAAPAVSRRGAP